MAFLGFLFWLCSGYRFVCFLYFLFLISLINLVLISINFIGFGYLLYSCVFWCILFNNFVDDIEFNKELRIGLFLEKVCYWSSFFGG